MNQPNQVQEMAPKPPGLLPKMSSRGCSSLALVMVLIMWLTAARNRRHQPRQFLPRRWSGSAPKSTTPKLPNCKPHPGVAARAARRRERSRAAKPPDEQHDAGLTANPAVRRSGQRLRRPPGRCHPSREEKARVPFPVFIQCCSQLPQTSVRRDSARDRAKFRAPELRSI